MLIPNTDILRNYRSQGESKPDSGATKAEVEDGEIEDAKMADVPLADRTAQKPSDTKATPSQRDSPAAQIAETQASANREQTSSEKDVTSARGAHPEADLPARPQAPASPAASQATSRISDSGRPANVPKRPEPERAPSSAQNTRAQAQGPHRFNREDKLPPRPDLLEDRRDRHQDYPRGGRFGGDHDYPRPFDPAMGDVRPYPRIDREYPRQPMDEPFRSFPHRDGRPPRDADWPDRPGRLRPDVREGPANVRSVPPTHPDRAGMIDDHSEGFRRGESGRQDRDDRRNLQPRALSPPRMEPLGRPERFPADDRRAANFAQSHARNEDMPTGPRSERYGRPSMDGADSRDTVTGIDMNHGRLRQPEPPTDVPSGPRGRNNAGRGGRNAAGLQHSQGPPASGAMAPTERQPPIGPGRQGLRNAPDQSTTTGPPSPGPEKLDTSGIHPDRLKVLQQQPQDNSYGGGQRSHHASSPASIVPPSGPRSGLGPPSGPAAMPRGPPSGPGFGGERGRGDKRFAGINNMLQQSGGTPDRGPGPTIRGRGANRQSGAMNAPSPQAARPPTPGAQEDGGRGGSASQGRPDLLAGRSSGAPYGEEDGPSRSRPGGSRGEPAEESSAESRRSQRFSSGTHPHDRERERDRDRERRGGEEEGSRSSSRREEHRDRNRDYERERSRRSDAGGAPGGPREERYESREASRRGPGAREDNRRRRDREEGSDIAPSNQEHEGRLRPPSSLGGQGPPPPPPPPLAGAEDDRRWGGGRELRDRDRERNRDRPRERDYHREGAPSGPHRKRNRPGDEGGHGDGGGRGGMRMGNESKRPRRGA